MDIHLPMSEQFCSNTPFFHQLLDSKGPAAIYTELFEWPANIVLFHSVVVPL